MQPHLILSPAMFDGRTLVREEIAAQDDFERY
jgi:hypothetical protein